MTQTLIFLPIVNKLTFKNKQIDKRKYLISLYRFHLTKFHSAEKMDKLLLNAAYNTTKIIKLFLYKTTNYTETICITVMIC